MRIYTTYPDVCKAIREAKGDLTIWCANEFLRMQAVRYAQFKQPQLRVVIRAVPISTVLRLVSVNRFALSRARGNRPLLKVVDPSESYRKDDGPERLQ